MSRRRGSRPPEANVQKHTIDLSKPPRERYKALAKTYYTKIQGLTPLFNSLLADLGIPPKRHGIVNKAANLLLRRVYTSVETAELKGIAEVTGMPMYLLVSFNVILDLLMGCTSGAVRAVKEDTPSAVSRMLHYRTLDWGMDPLRDIVVQLNFVRSKSEKPSEIIAKSITYVGFVGVLTGVRPQLSLSLNFRPVHNAATRGEQFRFYLHHLLVLLGLRQSISSILRQYLFPEKATDAAEGLDDISKSLPSKHTTAAYLIFSNGDETITMEKDFSTAIVRRSSTFIVATNHDKEDRVSQPNATTPAGEHAVITAKAAGLAELLDESKDRMECIAKKWKDELRSRKRVASLVNGVFDESEVAIQAEKVIQWVSAWPTTNETTHYAVVMDPKLNQVVWAHAYANPPKEPTYRYQL